MSELMYMGVDYGSTYLKIGLVSRRGEVYEYKKYRSGGSAVQTLERAIEEYLSCCQHRPAAIGVGLVGLLDSRNGVWVHSLNMNIQQPFPLVRHLQKCFGLPVFIDNDVHAATLAEKCFGVGRVTDDFVLINVGTGVAAGMVSAGRLIRGVKNAAGEIGHMCVDAGGAPCTCGNRGCLEMIAGGRALAAAARNAAQAEPHSLLAQMYAKAPLADTVFRAAQKGDPAAMSLSTRAVQALGIGIVNLVNALNPEHVVLTGSVVNSDYFFEGVRDYVYEHAYITALRSLAGFSRSQVAGGHPGVCGAAALCWNMQREGDER